MNSFRKKIIASATILVLFSQVGLAQPSIPQSRASHANFYGLLRQFDGNIGYWSAGYLDQWDLIKLDDVPMDAELRAIRKLKAGDDHDKIIAAVRKYWSENRPTIVSYKVAWDKLVRRDATAPIRLVTSALVTDVGTKGASELELRSGDAFVINYTWALHKTYFPNSNPRNFNIPGLRHRFDVISMFYNRPGGHSFRFPSREEGVVPSQLYASIGYLGLGREVARMGNKRFPNFLPYDLQLIVTYATPTFEYVSGDMRTEDEKFDSGSRIKEAFELATKLRQRYPNRADVFFFYLNTVPDAQFLRQAPDYLKMDDLQWRKITIDRYYRILQERVKRGSKLFDKWP